MSVYLHMSTYIVIFTLDCHFGIGCILTVDISFVSMWKWAETVIHRKKSVLQQKSQRQSSTADKLPVYLHIAYSPDQQSWQELNMQKWLSMNTPFRTIRYHTLNIKDKTNYPLKNSRIYNMRIRYSSILWYFVYKFILQSKKTNFAFRHFFLLPRFNLYSPNLMWFLCNFFRYARVIIVFLTYFLCPFRTVPLTRQHRVNHVVVHETMKPMMLMMIMMSVMTRLQNRKIKWLCIHILKLVWFDIRGKSFISGEVIVKSFFLENRKLVGEKQKTNCRKYVKDFLLCL